MRVLVVDRPVSPGGSWGRLSAVVGAAVGLLAALAVATPAAAQILPGRGGYGAASGPQANDDVSGKDLFLTPLSTLRYGESLLSRQYLTVGSSGVTVKGTGRCTQANCPVQFNNIPLFARRSRLRYDIPAPAPVDPNKPPTGIDQRDCQEITGPLRPGDRGPQVSAMQRILNRLGYTDVNIDGSYGTRSVRAVEDFQRKQGLGVDGRFGRGTRERACGIGPGYPGGTGTPPPPPPQSGYPGGGSECGEIRQTLRPGDRGPQVNALQRILQRLGYDMGTLDGSYGRKTQAAVELYQRKEGLPVDGRVGPRTLERLCGGSSAGGYTPPAAGGGAPPLPPNTPGQPYRRDR